MTDISKYPICTRGNNLLMRPYINLGAKDEMTSAFKSAFVCSCDTSHTGQMNMATSDSIENAPWICHFRTYAGVSACQ